MKKTIEIVVGGIIVTVLAVAAIFLIKWQNVNWGKIQLAQPETVTVVGEAKGQQKSQISKFSATVNRVNDDKQKAIDEVNENMKQVIAKIKGFGIDEKDIKTQSVSIYQNQETYYEDGRQKQRMGQWNVSNSIEITLRDVAKTSELTNLLADSGANNVWGPNFYVDETTSIEADLSKQAIDNAKEKAGKIAEASGKKLGKIVSINEGGTSSGARPLAYEGGGGGGAPVEPGTIAVEKQITVVFELKD